MILLTAAQAAEEFRVSKRMVQHWGQVGTLKRHKPERAEYHGGRKPYLYERAQVKRVVSQMRSRDRRGGRSRQSPATLPPPA